MKKLHNACFINMNNLAAIWSEIYVDPKFDSSCYIVRVLFNNNPTILTVASYDQKSEADDLIKRLVSNEKIA